MKTSHRLAAMAVTILAGALPAGVQGDAGARPTGPEPPLIANGADTPGVVRGNTWYLRTTNTGGSAEFTFGYGQVGDIPIVGDWNGDGIDTPGVVRGNTWYLRNSNTAGAADIEFAYGQTGDTPLAGDWDNDGDDSPGVVRGRTWYLRNSNSGGSHNITFAYGIEGDAPLTGHWGTPPPASPLGTQIVDTAQSQVGVQETGDNCNPYGYCAAWCAMFAEWVWRESGVDPVFTTDIARGVGAWGVEQGLFSARPDGTRGGSPQPGDIVVYGEPAYVTGGHVGIVESVLADGRLVTIDGNYNDAVTRRDVDPLTTTTNGHDISGYVRPPGA